MTCSQYKFLWSNIVRTVQPCLSEYLVLDFPKTGHIKSTPPIAIGYSGGFIHAFEILLTWIYNNMMHVTSGPYRGYA